MRGAIVTASLLVAVAVFAAPAGASPMRPDAPCTIRRPDGSLYSWGFRGDSAEVAARRSAGWIVEEGEPTEAEQAAFYSARDGKDRRGSRPRVESVIDADGRVVAWGYGPRGVCGPPPPGGRVEARPPSRVELEDMESRRDAEVAKAAAIRIAAQADAARRLGLDADADALDAEAEAALTRSRR